MRLFLFTTLTMVAFAGNSMLTRAGVGVAGMSPLDFGLIRVAAGALTLAILVRVQGQKWPALNIARFAGAVSLSVYLIGFSVAYLLLDAGLGALILFGVVQIAMFLHQSINGQSPGARQIAGAGVAFIGLCIALWPGPGAIADSFSAAWMVLAGLGWAAYSVIGRAAKPPLSATAVHFLLCLPIMAVVWLAFAPPIQQFSSAGIVLAMVSGAVTSGLGYALWYHVLPQLAASTSAIVQLSVPIIALLGGAIFLDEPAGLTVSLAAMLVVGGIALGTYRTNSSKGS